MTNKLIEELAEMTLKKLLSNEKIVVEERTGNYNWDWFSVRFVEKQARSALVNDVYSVFDIKLKEKVEAMKQLVDDYIQKAILEHLWETKIKECVRTRFEEMVNDEVGYKMKESGMQKALNVIKESEKTYSDYREKDARSKIEWLIKEDLWRAAQKYVEENADEIRKQVKDGARITVTVTPPPITISSSDVINFIEPTEVT